MTGLGVAIFVVAILLMILLHEAGHFFTAKWFGIKVEEFFVGFGPKLWSTRRGETEYGVKAIPAGGYVRIAGMNPYQEIAPEDRDRVFQAKPPWQRAIVLAAGSTTHFLLAFLMLLAFFLFIGVPVFSGPLIGRVEPTLDGAPSPAAEAGLVAGDRILAVNGERVEDNDEVVRLTRANAGEEISLLILRGKEEVDIAITPVLAEIDGQRVGRLGVVLTQEVVGRDTSGPIHAMQMAGSTTGEITVASVKGLGQIFSLEGLGRIGELITGQAERSPEDPAGIVGAGRLAGQAAQAGNLDQLLLFLAALNIFVGIFNILPLPPLDGGHLAVLAVEKVRGRPVDVRKLLPLTAAVAGLLILFMLSLTYLDIVSPIPNPFR